MAWILLIVAGLLETGWAIGLTRTDGFTRLWPSVFTAAAIALSMILLAVAVRTLPIGTAYAVWVGIGGVARRRTPASCCSASQPTPARHFVFWGCLIFAIVGLKFTAH